MEGLELACRDPALSGVDPEKITFYSRRVMVVPRGKVPGMAGWRERLFAAMHLKRQSGGRLFWSADRAGRRGRPRSRDLNAERLPPLEKSRNFSSCASKQDADARMGLC